MFVQIRRNLGAGWPQLREGESCHVEEAIARRLMGCGLAVPANDPDAVVEKTPMIKTVPSPTPVIILDAPPAEIQADVEVMPVMPQPTESQNIKPMPKEAEADDDDSKRPRRPRREFVPQVRTSEPRSETQKKEPE